MAEFEKTVKEENLSKETGEKKQNLVLRNLFGALLGGLIGYVFWVLVSYFIGGNVHIAVAYVMAACVFYGSFFFAKKDANAFPIIYAIVSVIFALLAYFTAQAIVYLTSVINSYGWDNSITTYLELIFPAIGVVIQGFFLQITEFVIMLIVLVVGIVQFTLNRKRLLSEWVQEAEEEAVYDAPTEEEIVEDILHEELMEEVETHSDTLVEEAEDIEDELEEFDIEQSKKEDKEKEDEF